MRKHQVKIRLTREVLSQAKALANRRGTSVGELFAGRIESIFRQDQEESYERAQRQALALLNKGFHLGGGVPADRDNCHDR